MKKEFSKSWSFRKKALFNEIASRGYELYFNNRWTKMNSDDRLWIIIFTKPWNGNKREKDDWFTKFWIWDSEENKIVGENILSFTVNAKKQTDATVQLSDLAECYLDLNFNKFILRSKGHSCYYIFDLQGTLLYQTESNLSVINDKKMHFSKFIEENIFFTVNNESVNLFKLNEVNGLVPKNMQILWGSRMAPYEKDIKLYYSSSMDYLAIFAYDDVVEMGCQYSPTIWLYKNTCYPDKTQQFDFVVKLSIDAIPENIEITKKEKFLSLSFHYRKYIGKDINEDPVTLELPLTLFNL